MVTDSPYDAPAKPLLSQLQLPSIAEVIRQESASMIYKAINDQAPRYFSSLFNSISVVMNVTLRNSNLNLRHPWLNTKCRKQFCILSGYDLELIVK